jgi:hypothetical protein
MSSWLEVRGYPSPSGRAGRTPSRRGAGREDSCWRRTLAPARFRRARESTRLPRDVHELGDARLHAIGHLVRGDSRFDLRLAHSFEVLLVERAHEVERSLRAAATRRRVSEENGIALGAKLHSLVDGGGIRFPAGLASVGVVLADSNTTNPGGSLASLPRPYVSQSPCSAAQIWCPVFMKICAGAWLNCARVERTGRRRSHDAGEMRQELRKLGAGVSVSAKSTGSRALWERLDESESPPSAASPDNPGRRAPELRLGIEEIEMRSAGHEQVDDALRLRRKMSLRSPWPGSPLEKTVRPPADAEPACGRNGAG